MEQSTTQTGNDLAYHYTSMGVFLKLMEGIENGHFLFHASYIDVMNDPSEFKFGYGKFFKALTIIEGESGIEDKYKLSAIATEDNMSVTDWNEGFIDYHTSMFHLPFVISFSNDKDNLGMWRSYGSNGNGVVLGFDKKAAGAKYIYLEEKDFSYNIPYAVDVSYGEINEVLKNVLTHRYNIYYEKIKEIKDEYLLVFKTNFLYRFCRFFASLIKHKAYEEENETRMVFFKNEKPEELHFKVNMNERLVPFIQVPIPVVSLKRIVVGPCCAFDSTKRDIETLLTNKGFEINDMVVKSEVPYRNT